MHFLNWQLTEQLINYLHVVTPKKADKKRSKEKSMIQVYCYEKCSTCKKAVKWLDDNKIKYELIDIKSKHPSATKLKQFYKMSGLPLKKFFNTSGMIYRDMELSKKLPDMSEAEQLKLLGTDGMLVKRPLVIGEDFVLTGFKEEEWKAALKKKGKKNK